MLNGSQLRHQCDLEVHTYVCLCMCRESILEPLVLLSSESNSSAVTRIARRRGFLKGPYISSALDLARADFKCFFTGFVQPESARGAWPELPARFDQICPEVFKNSYGDRAAFGVSACRRTEHGTSTSLVGHAGGLWP